MSRKSRQAVLTLKEVMGVLATRLDASKAALMADADRDRESYIAFRMALVGMTGEGHEVMRGAAEDPDDEDLQTRAAAIEAEWRQEAMRQIAAEEAEETTHYEPTYAPPEPVDRDADASDACMLDDILDGIVGRRTRKKPDDEAD
jgi:hypothetical protein